MKLVNLFVPSVYSGSDVESDAGEDLVRTQLKGLTTFFPVTNKTLSRYAHKVNA